MSSVMIPYPLLANSWALAFRRHEGAPVDHIINLETASDGSR